MLRRRAILVAWAAVAIPGMAAVASCVQDLPEGSVPELESGSDGTMKDSPAPPEDHAMVEGSPDAPSAEAEPDVSEDVSDAESADADAETEDADAESADADAESTDAQSTDAESDVADGGMPQDSGDGGDAGGVADASDAGDAGSAGDAGDASDASDASDAGGGNDASDASGPPCTFIASGAECQASDSCTVKLAGPSVAGDLLVLVFAAGVDVTPSIPAGWLQATFQADGANNMNIGIWYYPNNPGGISSVTVTIGATGSVRGLLSEWRNASQLDQSASLLTPSSKSQSVTTPGITASGECAVSTFGEKLSLAKAVVFTPGTGWTNFDNNGASPTDYHVTVDYLLGPPVGAVSEDETSDTLGDWVGTIATFR